MLAKSLKHPKMPKKDKRKKNGGVLELRVASVVGGSHGRLTLGALHCAKVELDVRCYENQSTFFFLVPRGKEKRSIFKMLVFNFLKIGL